MENYLHVDHSGQTRPTGECKNLSAQKGLSPQVDLERPFDVIKHRTAKSVHETIHGQLNESQGYEQEYSSHSEGPTQYMSHNQRYCFNSREAALTSQQQDCIERARKLGAQEPERQGAPWKIE